MHTIEEFKAKFIPIAKNYGVSKMMLFGSYAKGNAEADSDVDILIEKGNPLSLLMLSGMRQDCEEAIGLSVDLVTTDGMDKDFYQLIKGSEVLLYDVKG